MSRLVLDVSLQVYSWERKDGCVKPGARREEAVLELKPGHHQTDRLSEEVPAGSPAVLHVMLLPRALGQMVEEAKVEAGRI